MIAFGNVLSDKQFRICEGKTHGLMRYKCDVVRLGASAGMCCNMSNYDKNKALWHK